MTLIGIFLSKWKRALRRHPAPGIFSIRNQAANCSNRGFGKLRAAVVVNSSVTVTHLSC
jgi:hypothetical protein